MRRVKPLATFGSPISDLELWRCAKLQVDQHGEGAIVEAYDRRSVLAEAGDANGVNTWLAIELRVSWLAGHDRDNEARQ